MDLCCPHWLTDFSRGLRNLQEQGLFCDVVIQTAECETYSAHANVLAAASPILSTYMQDSGLFVKFDEISAQTWQRLLEFMYTGKVFGVPPSDAHLLYEAARKLGIDTLTSLIDSQPDIKPHLASTEQGPPTEFVKDEDDDDDDDDESEAGMEDEDNDAETSTSGNPHDEEHNTHYCKTTTKTTKYVVKTFRDWLVESKLNADFEQLPKKELAKLLKQFYGEVRDKRGAKYRVNTMKSIRTSLQRHLNEAPHNRMLNLKTDPKFQSANKIFDEYIKEQEGLGQVRRVDVFLDKDWEKLHKHAIVTALNPRCLQNKVFLNIMTYFGRRGREGLRNLTKDSFILKRHPNGTEYYEEVSGLKKDKVGVDKPVMWAQANAQCPVNGLKFYLTKLHPSSPFLFTTPIRKVKINDNTWYNCKPLGKNTLGNMMKTLSKEAGLSKLYTNDCIRITTCPTMRLPVPVPSIAPANIIILPAIPPLPASLGMHTELNRDSNQPLVANECGSETFWGPITIKPEQP